MSDFKSSLPTTDLADGSASGGTAASNSILIGGQYNSALPTLTSGQQVAAQVDSNARLYVNSQVTAPATDYQITGTLTGSASVVILTGLNSVGAVNVDVSGSGFVGSIAVQEAYTSGGRTLPVQALSTGAFQSTITANGNYRVFGIAATSNVQVMFTSYTSGSANITIRASTATNIVQATQLNPSNFLTSSYAFDGSGNPISSTNGGLNVSAVSAADTFATGTITVQDTGSTTTTYFNGQTWYSGTPTTGSVFAVSTVGIETGMVEISGTWTGTVQTEVSVDSGVNWIQHSIHQIGSASFISTYTNNVAGSLNLAGKTNFRVRAVAPITGTVSVRLIESQNVSNVYVANSIKILDSSGNSLTSYNSQLSTDDVINSSISSGSITVSTTAVPARVSSTNLANRKMLMISPVSTTVYMGASSSVTTANGTPIFPGQVISFAFSANVTPYLIAASSGTVNVFEGA